MKINTVTKFDMKIAPKYMIPRRIAPVSKHNLENLLLFQVLNFELGTVPQARRQTEAKTKWSLTYRRA